MIDAVTNLGAQIVTGLISGAMVLTVAGFTIKRFVARQDRTDARLQTLEDKRVQAIENDVAQIKGHCEQRHAAIAGDLQAGARTMSALQRGLDVVNNTLSHQAAAFRDMSLDLKRYTETTAMQGVELTNVVDHLKGLHDKVTRHVENGRVHNG